MKLIDDHNIYDVFCEFALIKNESQMPQILM